MKCPNPHPKALLVQNINIPNGEDDYVDKRTGTTWKYFATLENEEELGPFLKTNWLYKYQEYPNTINCRCYRALKTKTRRENCQFRAVFLKANCTVYTKEQHNHPIFDKGRSNKIFCFLYHSVPLNVSCRMSYRRWKSNHCSQSYVPKTESKSENLKHFT